jgi:hypothetical protein
MIGVTDVDPNEVWTGTNADEDWDRCRRLMKHFGRDGRKLELWRLWLGFHHNGLNEPEMTEKAKGKRKQWTEDDEPMPFEAAAAAKLCLSKDTVTVAPRECCIAVLEKYVRPPFITSKVYALNSIKRPQPFSTSLSSPNPESSS